jgi:hypothetical protein
MKQANLYGIIEKDNAPKYETNRKIRMIMTEINNKKITLKKWMLLPKKIHVKEVSSENGGSLITRNLTCGMIQ